MLIFPGVSRTCMHRTRLCCAGSVAPQDEIQVTSTDIELAGRSAALIHQFLDGQKTSIDEHEGIT